MTADDTLHDAHARRRLKRARQNVILEAGFLSGALGRHGRLVFVVDKDPELDLPSDLNGLAWVPITPDLGDTKLHLRRELAASRILLNEGESQRLAPTRPSGIEGRWVLRLQDSPPDLVETWMRMELDGTRLKVIGDSWSGSGSFAGTKGYYDWEFHDGTRKTGHTEIRLDESGILYGEVHGSEIDWSYWAIQQRE